MKTTVIGSTAGSKVNGTTAGLHKIQLVNAEQVYQEPLVTCVCGGPGSGKSRLIGTAKDMVGLIPTEQKTLQSALKAAREPGKTIIKPDKDLIRVANPILIASLPKTCIVIGDANHKNWTAGQIQDAMQEIADTISLDGAYPTCCQRHYYRWHVNREKYAAYMMADDSRIETIAIDSFGTFVDDVSYANYGLTGVIDPKEFGFAPREDMVKEIREFLNAINHKHLILTHHIKEVWKDGKPTKKYKPESQFSGIGYIASVMLELERDDNAIAKNKEAEQAEQVDGEKRGRLPVYIARVRDCQANASLIGVDILTDESINFQNLGCMVYEDSDPDYWV